MLGIEDLIAGIYDHMLWNFTQSFELHEAKGLGLVEVDLSSWKNGCRIVDKAAQLDEVTKAN